MKIIKNNIQSTWQVIVAAVFMGLLSFGMLIAVIFWLLLQRENCTARMNCCCCSCCSNNREADDDDIAAAVDPVVANPPWQLPAM